MGNKRNEVEIGATFQSQSRGAFDQPSKTVWRVEAISRATYGLPHARLVNAADPQASRLVAGGALLDGKLYRRAG